MSKFDETTKAAIIKKLYELFPRDKTNYILAGKALNGFTEQETQAKIKEYYAFVDSLNIDDDEQKVVDSSRK